MRKLAFLSVFLCVFGMTQSHSFAAAVCNGPMALTFHGNQDPDDNEFLYKTLSEFNKAKEGYKNSNHQSSGDGRGYECDEINTGGCGCDAIVELPAGHVFKGKTVNRKVTYQCDCGLGDSWKEVSGKCWAPAYGEIEVGKWFTQELSKEQCSGYSLSDENGSKFRLLCREGPELICKAIECKQGYKLNSNTGKCTLSSTAKTCDGKALGTIEKIDCKDIVQSNKAHAIKCEKICHECNNNKDKACWLHRIVECESPYIPDNNQNKCVSKGNGTSPSPTPTVSCRDGRTTTNGKACCDTGNLGIYDETKDTCTCKNDLDFVIENGKGFCRAKPNAPIFTCPESQLTWIANLKISCGNNTEIQSQIAMIESYCKGANVAESAFNEYMSSLMTLSAQVCGGAQSDEQKLCDKISDAHMIGEECKCDDAKKELDRTQQRCVDSAATIAERKQEESKANIVSIVGKINNLKSGLNTSVWKNKEGNFNTSRLVSDSVAGVVLGTAGGLITSNVIKKNQIKGGFEDISCTVRGQVVAGYGDEFQVGIQ